jgi:DNA-binding MurR/RpiR family transcriptional regulator
MDYEERIREAYPRLSKSFLRLADYILDSYIETAFMTATELGHAVDVDATTVVRFSQQLGYEGYPDLLKSIRERVKGHLILQPVQNDHNGSAASVVKTALQELRTVFGQAYLLLDVSQMEQLVDSIANAERVVLMPDALAQPAAYTLVNLLERGNISVTVAQTNLTDLARTVQVAEPGDLLLAIEVVGDLPYISRTLTAAAAKGIKTAAIVGSSAIETTRVTDIVLAAQAQPSPEIGMMLVNAVVYALGQTLRWQDPTRFLDVDQSIQELAAQIRTPAEIF